MEKILGGKMVTSTPKKPHNVTDLKKLLQQYGNVLTPQNKKFINELITKLENGANRGELQELADRMKKAADKNKKR